MLLGQVEKEMLRKHLWLVAERCGIEVLTYQVMTNHLHIMVRAPRREPLPDAELLLFCFRRNVPFDLMC